MKAMLKNYRQSPRKVRLIAGLIKGKRIKDADIQLSFLIKRGALPIKKLLASAVANAVKNFGMNPDTLIVKEICVDKGVVLKRSMPRARGSASRINKRSSHVTITLGEFGETKKAQAKAVKAEKVEVKKEKVEKKDSKPIKKAPAKKAAAKKK
ncbi:MAG: 50S ribosomal protein L22 [Candidatus Paceibacterota bacterium]|jgi:large subunit ribosomal protein L22